MKEVVGNEAEMSLETLQKSIATIIGVSAQRGEQQDIEELNKNILKNRTVAQKNIERKAKNTKDK